MPNTVVYYECTICGRRFDRYEKAVSCEERGMGAEYPIGCIFGDHRLDSITRMITFAVASNKLEEHANWGNVWACRDSKYGDAFGAGVCSSNSLRLYTHSLDPEHPTFKRMVAFLNESGIPITVWWEGRAISLAQYLDVWEEIRSQSNERVVATL